MLLFTESHFLLLLGIIDVTLGKIKKKLFSSLFVPPSPSSRSPGIEFNHSAASVCCWVCSSQPDVWGVPPPTSTRFLESCGTSQTKSKMWDVTGTFNYRSFHVMQSQYKLLPVSPPSLPSTPPVPFVLFIHLTPPLLFSLPIWLVPCSIWSLSPLVLLTPLLLLSLTFPSLLPICPFLFRQHTRRPFSTLSSWFWSTELTSMP